MSRYLLMIAGFLFVIFPVQAGSYELERQMEKDTNQQKLTHKETSTWSRMRNDLGEQHYQRLYDAYRDRWKGQCEKAGREAKMGAKLAPIKEDIAPMKKTLIKPVSKEKFPLSGIKYDATDDRSVPSSKCLALCPLSKKDKDMKGRDQEWSDRRASDDIKRTYNTQVHFPLKNKEKDIKEKYKESPQRKRFEESKRIQLKKKDREKPKETPNSESLMINLQKYKEKSDFPIRFPPNPKDDRNRRIMELNRIYNEYLKAWQQPSLSNSFKTAMTPSGTVELSAMVDLLNVVERFQKGQLVRDLAKKISQEMEPNLTSIIDYDAHLVTDSRASLKGIIKNDLSGQFENMKPSNSSAAFKEILADVKSRRATIKAGGLYNEYKKGFSTIFNDQKYTRHSEFKADIAAINCNNEKSKKPSKVSEPSVPVTSSKNKNYLKALETFTKMYMEENQNGGPKPFFLPNSKNRQLIYNEIPLVTARPSGPSNKPQHSGGKLKSFKTSNKDKVRLDKQAETNVAAPKVKYVPKQNIAKLKEPAPKTDTKESPENPWDDLYSGLDPKLITNGLKAIKSSSFFNLVDEYQKQVVKLNQALKTKQGWWKEARPNRKSSVKKPAKRNIYMNNPPAPFPEVLVNQAPQMGVNVLGNMANQMHVSPIEMAQRIVGAGQAPAVQQRMPLPQPQMQLASQLGGSFVPKQPEFSYNIPCQQQQQQQCQQQEGISPVLDKILQRLETIQANKCNQSEEENLPCCFVDPADGAPCDLNGSWESLVLGVRINIKSHSQSMGEPKPLKSCSQKNRRPKNASSQRFRRQCVKMNPKELKEMSQKSENSIGGIALNISVQETVPPRAHDLLDNLSDWHFSGNTQSILGGPISLSFRKVNSNLIGHFVGYCRTCGCLDTIFGSWTFCQPSRDCQDIAMSIVDRRDMLRRYSMDERRKSRFKEQLYLGSKFAKMEKERLSQEHPPEKLDGLGHK